MEFDDDQDLLDYADDVDVFSEGEEVQPINEIVTAGLEVAACPLLTISASLLRDREPIAVGASVCHGAVPTYFRWFRKSSSSILPQPPSDISKMVASLLSNVVSRNAASAVDTEQEPRTPAALSEFNGVQHRAAAASSGGTAAVADHLQATLLVAPTPFARREEHFVAEYSSGERSRHDSSSSHHHTAAAVAVAPSQTLVEALLISDDDSDEGSGNDGDDSIDEDEVLESAMALMEMPPAVPDNAPCGISESDSRSSTPANVLGGLLHDSNDDDDDDDDDSVAVDGCGRSRLKEGSLRTGCLGSQIPNDADNEVDDDADANEVANKDEERLECSPLQHGLPGEPALPDDTSAAISRQLSPLLTLNRSLSSSSASTQFEISQVVDERDGKVLVKWKGYPSNTNSWEPTASMVGAADALADFRQRNPLVVHTTAVAKMTVPETAKTNRVAIMVEETDDDEDSDTHEDEDEDDNSPVIARKGQRRRAHAVLSSQPESHIETSRASRKRPHTIPESEEDEEKSGGFHQAPTAKPSEKERESSDSFQSTSSPNRDRRRMRKRKKKIMAPPSTDGKARTKERTLTATNQRQKHPRAPRSQVATFFADSAVAGDGEDDDDGGGLAGDQDYYDSQDSFINDSDPYTASEPGSSSQSRSMQKKKAPQISPNMNAIYFHSLLSPADASDVGKHSFGPRGQYGGAENKLVYGAKTPSPQSTSSSPDFNYDNPSSPRHVKRSVR